MVPSCMSLSRLGITNETAGRSSKSVGNALSGWFVLAGSEGKLTHGLCLAAYLPLVQPVKPTLGRPSL